MELSHVDGRFRISLRFLCRRRRCFPVGLISHLNQKAGRAGLFIQYKATEEASLRLGRRSARYSSSPGCSSDLASGASLLSDGFATLGLLALVVSAVETSPLPAFFFPAP